VDELELPADILDNPENVTSAPGNYYCSRADLWGDSREEVTVAGRNGLCIYANGRPMAIPTLYSNTCYHGM